MRFAVITYNGILAHIPEIDLDSFPDGRKVIYREFSIWDGQPLPVLGVGEEQLLNYPGDYFAQFFPGSPVVLSNLIYRLGVIC